MLVEYTGGAYDLTPLEEVMSGLPFSSVTDMFFFIGILVVAGLLIVHAVYKIAQAIKGD